MHDRASRYNAATSCGRDSTLSPNGSPGVLLLVFSEKRRVSTKRADVDAWLASHPRTGYTDEFFVGADRTLAVTTFVATGLIWLGLFHWSGIGSIVAEFQPMVTVYEIA
jgi:hypothetical protein